MSRNLILFDVDGTLTESRLQIKSSMEDTLRKLKSIEDLDIGIVGGSDLAKQEEQLGKENLSLFNWVFSENGLVAFKEGEQFHSQNMVSKLGQDAFTALINICLKNLALCKYPVKTGTFIETRTGMVNICPVGRSCTQEQREAFCKEDETREYRRELIKHIQAQWNNYLCNSETCKTDMRFSIGGQISVDVFPNGWDKTYCLQFVREHYDKIYFFGDKTYEGGNDYEIFNSPETIGFTVKSPEETERLLYELFIKPVKP